MHPRKGDREGLNTFEAISLEDLIIRNMTVPIEYLGVILISDRSLDNSHEAGTEPFARQDQQ